MRFLARHLSALADIRLAVAVGIAAALAILAILAAVLAVRVLNAAGHQSLQDYLSYYRQVGQMLPPQAPGGRR